jgi:PA14 domain
VLDSGDMKRALTPPLVRVASVLLLASCCVPLFGVRAAQSAAQAPVSREPMATFGTTVFSSSGLRGDIYFLKPGTAKLPRVERGKPVGSVYTNVLQVPARDFREGFPGVTDRVEWFVIEYNGRFWIHQTGDYDFSLSSDDGSKLYIDGKLVINNDGLHSVEERTGSATLKTGAHRIKVSYFQGPGDGVALILNVARPGEGWRPFDLDKFLPPAGHENWK